MIGCIARTAPAVRPKSLIFAILLGIATSLIAVAPAAAARWDGTDEAGDAPAAVDISHVTVWNGSQHLITRIRFYDLRRNRVRGVGVTVDTGARNGEGYLVNVRWSRSKERFVRRLWWRPDLGDLVADRLPCRGIGVDWQAGPEYLREWVKISLPQRCLGEDAGAIHLLAGTSLRGDAPEGDIVPHLGSRQYVRQVIPRG